MAFTLPPLPYSFDALDPYIDALTMEIHHDKHHGKYVEELNKALSTYPEWNNKPLVDILRNIDQIPDAIRTAVRNNGGGHFNHSLFWDIMKKNGGGKPRGTVATAITTHFGSFESFQQEFEKVAKTRFGSGWAWLSLTREGRINLHSTANQDCPLMEGLIPFFGLDVWEHAYYLKYQNRRPEYITAWWHVVNWDQVEENYRTVLSSL